jgi:hypothetical protein
MEDVHEDIAMMTEAQASPAVREQAMRNLQTAWYEKHMATMLMMRLVIATLPPQQANAMRRQLDEIADGLDDDELFHAAEMVRGFSRG